MAIPDHPRPLAAPNSFQLLFTKKSMLLLNVNSRKCIAN